MVFSMSEPEPEPGPAPAPSRQTQESEMYANTLFEPIYGHSDWGSALVAFLIIALSLGSSWVVGSVAVKFSSKN